MRDRKESEKAIRAFSYRVMRRLAAAGDHSLTQEDVQQELWLAWVVACQNYDAESGVPFLAYLQNGMRQHINRYIEKHVDRRHDEVTALSLDMTLEGNDLGEAGDTFGEAVPSDDPHPGVGIEEESQFRWALSKLKPQAQMFLTLLKEQPVELLEEVRRVSDRCDYAKSRGIPGPFNNRLTAPMIFDLMGVSRVERIQITDELRKIGARACRLALK